MDCVWTFDIWGGCGCSVSLKAQVSMSDLERLINEVRHRVEFEDSKQVKCVPFAIAYHHVLDQDDPDQNDRFLGSASKHN